MNMFVTCTLLTSILYQLTSGSPKGEAGTDDDDWDEMPKIKEVADGPYYDQFEYNVTRNYTVIAGMPAEILCRVKIKPAEGNKTVSWLRHRDIHLLTSGTHTYSHDKRFSTVHRFPESAWVLRIQQTQINDTGIYQCQLGATPPVGITFNLNVVEPITSIIGEPDIYINQGSNLNITCVIKNWPIMDNPFSPSESQQVLWEHESEAINYDSLRGGVSVVTEKSNRYSSSSLLIIDANTRDSGRYTCKPDLANQTSVTVHVLPGENPAAMKNDGNSKVTSGVNTNTTPKSDINNTCRISLNLISIIFIIIVNINHM